MVEVEYKPSPFVTAWDMYKKDVPTRRRTMEEIDERELIKFREEQGI